MPLDASWMDEMPAVTLPGQGTAPASGAAPAPHRLPTLVVKPGGPSDEPPEAKPADTAWMDELPPVTLPHDDLKAAQDKQAKGGLLRNIGAGTSEATAGLLGAPVDLATGALNLGSRGINAVAGTNIPPIEKPFAGSDWWKSAEGLIGADPRNVEAQTQVERLGRAGGQGVAGVMLPGAAARALPAMAGGVPEVIRKAVAAGTNPTVAAGGFTGGVAGQELEDSAPEALKPMANLTGQVIGGGLPIAARAAAGAITNALKPAVGHFVAPLTAKGRAGLAGERIAGAATDPAAVREALAAPPRELVPGSEPTTYQLTGDQGLGNLERGVAKENPDLFLGRAASQNAARAGVVEKLAPEKASTEAIGREFQAQLKALDAAHEAEVGKARAAGQAGTEGLGGAVPAGADQQTTALQGYGQRLREGLSKLNAAARQRVSALYEAVDPDGTLVVDMRDIKAAAKKIAAEVPKNAAPMEGDAGAILGVAQMQPGAQPFREVAALRSRITDAMRSELYENGRSQTYRRLTQMLAAVDSTMENGVETALQNPELAERVNAALQRLAEQQTEARAGTGVAGGTGEASGPQSGAAGSAAGTGNAPQRGFGDAARNSGVAGSAGRQPLDAVAFLQSIGGIKPNGETRAMDASRIRPGLIRLNGLNHDRAREALEEAGYLRGGSTEGTPQTSDLSDFYDLLNKGLRGQKHYGHDQPLRPSSDARAARISENAAEGHREDINMRAENAGIRMSPDEVEHAVRMTMDGAHPEEAIHEALTASSERTADAAGDRRGFDTAPGMPPTATQGRFTGVAEEPASALTPNFDAAAAERFRTANKGHAARVQTFEDAPGVGPALATGKRAGEYRMGDSQVAASIFNSGKGAAERVQAFLKAGGDNAALVRDLQEYASFSLRRAAEDAQGLLDTGKANRWLAAHQEALTAFPELAAKFRNAAMARATLDETAVRTAAERAAYEKSAASHFLGDADPVVRMGKILRSDTADAQMRQLAKMTARNPEARAGLQRAVVEHIQNELQTNSVAGETGIRQLKNDAFQTFVRKASPGLRHVFSDQQLASIRDLAADIQRTQRSVTGTKLPSGSNTAQDVAAGIHAQGGKPSVVGLLIAAEAAGGVASHAGGPISRAATMVGVGVMNAMRQAGLGKVDDLVTQAMLHPELARALLAKVPAGKFADPVLRNAARQIGALSGGAAQQQLRKAQ